MSPSSAATSAATERAPAPIPRLSIVIPTFGRAERAARLVAHLATQTLPPDAFEVIVVDDGSPEDPTPSIEKVAPPFHLVVTRQVNSGAAAARHRGATLARADVVLFLDDDMIPAPDLAEQHLAVHAATPRAVVLGQIRSIPDLAKLSLFDRFHARKLEQFAASLRATGRPPRGTELCSGNLSVRRADYLAVGGFDPSLARSEDMELGLRLEQSGAAIRFSDAAWTIHDTDHTSAESWLRGAFTYGVSDHRIAHKHPTTPAASPWHYLDLVGPLPTPAYALAIAAPAVGQVATRAVMTLAGALDTLGLERAALAGTMLAYGMAYYRGVRTEAGSAAACLHELREHRAARATAPHVSQDPHVSQESRAPRDPSASREPNTSREPNVAREPHLPRRARPTRMERKAAFTRFLAAVRADHDMLQRGDAKYDTRGREPSSLAHDLVERIGFQMLVGIRLMHLCKDAGSPLAAKVAARAIRLVYGADIHWNAHIAPGIAINHGMGLAIGHSARIARGVILSHNVGIGDGIDPVTHLAGQPIIEEDVHIGPGALLLGPITIGARSKLGPNVVVMQSIPPSSVVEAPAPLVRPRAARPTVASPLTGGAIETQRAAS